MHVFYYESLEDLSHIYINRNICIHSARQRFEGELNCGPVDHIVFSETNTYSEKQNVYIDFSIYIYIYSDTLFYSISYLINRKMQIIVHFVLA